MKPRWPVALIVITGRIFLYMAPWRLKVNSMHQHVFRLSLLVGRNLQIVGSVGNPLKKISSHRNTGSVTTSSSLTSFLDAGYERVKARARLNSNSSEQSRWNDHHMETRIAAESMNSKLSGASFRSIWHAARQKEGTVFLIECRLNRDARIVVQLGAFESDRGSFAASLHTPYMLVRLRRSMDQRCLGRRWKPSDIEKVLGRAMQVGLLLSRHGPWELPAAWPPIFPTPDGAVPQSGWAALPCSRRNNAIAADPLVKSAAARGVWQNPK